MQETDSSSKWKIGALIAAGLIATWLAWHYADQNEARLADQRFNFQKEQIIEEISNRLRAYENVLVGGLGLYNASNEVERHEWRSYVSSMEIEERYPGIQAMGFVEHIQHPNKAAYVAKMRKEGFPEYAVWPAGERAEYAAVTFVEPFDQSNQRVLGFDMFSEPTRRTALEQARDSGSAAITGPVKLIVDKSTDAPMGFDMFIPFYQGAAPVNEAQRRASLRGYVYGAFRMNELMLSLGKFTPDIALEIYEGNKITNDALIFSSDPDMRKSRRSISSVRQIDIFGHIWTLHLRTLPSFEAGANETFPLLVAIFGVVLTGLAALLLWSQLGTSRALRLATNMAASIRENEERLRSVIETAIDGIITIDDHGIIESCNPATQKIFGYATAEMVGKNVSMLMPEPDKSRHDLHISRYLRTKEAHIIGFGREVVGLRKDGTTFPMELSVGEIHAGNQIKFTGMVRDITQRHQAEQELRIAAIALEAQEGILITDRDKHIIRVNRAFTRQTGYSAEELIGRTPVLLRSGRHDAEFYRVQWEAVDRKKYWQGEIWNRRKDGRIYPDFMSISAVTDKNGQVTNYVATFYDISEQKAAEQALSLARDAAESANRAKSEFLSSMSHELRTPLNAILGFSQLMGFDPQISKEYKGNIHEIQKAGHHLLTLINEILDLSAVESGKLELSLEEVHCDELVRDCLNLIESQAAKAGITLECADFRGIAVRADRMRIKQVLLNFISNAIKYNRPHGHVRLWPETLPVPEAEGGERVRLHIADTGSGIPTGRMSELFKSFSRLDANANMIEGTGIGLVITKHLAELMGGSVGVSSELGKGSDFWIELPLVEAPLIPAVDAPAVPVRERSAESDSAGDKRATALTHTVLYIEDNPVNLQLVVQILAKRPHIRLLTAHMAESGLSMAASQHVDLILLDIGLRNMDGFQALAALRQQSKTRHTPVIAISANAMPHDIERGMKAGFDDYLTKPLNVTHFLAVVDERLRESS